MQKTLMGITVGMMGAAVFFLGIFGGYLIAGLLVGYILLFESNEWLKISAIKAIAFMLMMSFFIAVLELVPNCIGVINNLVGIFGGSFSIGILTKVISTLTSALGVVEKIAMLSFGMKALNQGVISIPIVDSLISKYMG